MRRSLPAALLVLVSCTMTEPVDERLTGADLHCSTGTKTCGRHCVGIDQPSTGCGSVACEPCQMPHASAVCVEGRCAPGVCEFGWQDCDRDPGNGCEEETDSCDCRAVEYATPNGSAAIPSVGMDFRNGDWTCEAWLKSKGDNPYWAFYSNGEGKEDNGSGIGLGYPRAVTCGIPTAGNPAPNSGVQVLEGVRPNQWQHVACERSGDTLRLYIDGKLRASSGVAEVISHSDAVMYRSSDVSGGPVMVGPVRVSKGARYGEDFVPERRWKVDEDTVLLYLVRHGLTDQRLTDEAGGDNTAIVNSGVVDGQGDDPCGAEAP